MLYLVLKNTEKQHICKNVHRRDLAKSLTSEQYVFWTVDRGAIGRTDGLTDSCVLIIEITVTTVMTQ